MSCHRYCLLKGSFLYLSTQMVHPFSTTSGLNALLQSSLQPLEPLIDEGKKGCRERAFVDVPHSLNEFGKPKHAYYI